jgi:hypothetical protein
MYIGCHDGSCITTNSLFEGNHIHHLRGTSIGGSDGIEIKFGSYGNVVRGNTIHDTTLARHYPGIFVYGGGDGVNIVEGNRIWRAGEGIQVVSDAIVRNNVLFDCTVTGITGGPHAAVPHVRNVQIVHNTIINHPIGVRIRWNEAAQMTFANNAIYCLDGTAIDASGLESHQVVANFVAGGLTGEVIDAVRWKDGGRARDAFIAYGEHDFRLQPGSVLIGAADARFTPRRDIEGRTREAPCDVGAYKTSTGERKRKNESPVDSHSSAAYRAISSPTGTD